jgi:hypothetical protein
MFFLWLCLAGDGSRLVKIGGSRLGACGIPERSVRITAPADPPWMETHVACQQELDWLVNRTCLNR